MYKVAIICGGNSLENEISVVTALGVSQVLRVNLVDHLFIYQDKEGHFYLYEGEPDIKSFLKSRRLKRGYILKDSKSPFIQVGISKKRFDLAWPLVHGKYTEDGTIKAFFDTLGIPVIANDIYQSSLIQNKYAFKRWCRQNGFPVLKGYPIKKSQIVASIVKLKKGYSYPVVIKPLSLGSSIGVGVANSEEELNLRLLEAFKYEGVALVEEFCPQMIEYNVALYQKCGELITSSIAITNKTDQVLSFSLKYLEPNKCEYLQEEDIICSDICSISRQVYELLDLTGVVRFDFMYSNLNHKLYLNEVNLIPGSLALNLFERKNKSRLAVIEECIDEGVRRNKKESVYLKSFEEANLQHLERSNKLKN